MHEDNTPTTVARRREPSSKQFLRREIGQRKHDAAVFKKTQANTKAILDNVPSDRPAAVLGCLAQPEPSTMRFKKRQINKTWLPTHLWHAKRAHMTPPREPLWSFAIPLTPTEKSYRMTHRASSLRGCVAWDMSYMCSIGVEGQEAALLPVLISVGVPEAQVSRSKGAGWRQGSRSWSGWVTEADEDQALISKAMVIWCPPSLTTTTRKLLIRVHPSAFSQFWDTLSKAAKLQEPQPMLEDLRYEIGSLEIAGPCAMAALVGILNPTELEDERAGPTLGPAHMFPKLASVTDSRCVPTGAMLPLSLSDPRFGVSYRNSESSKLSPAGDELAILLSTWPLHCQLTLTRFFDRQARLHTNKSLLTQKEIDRHKKIASPGGDPVSLLTDPEIPALMAAENHGKMRCLNGSWTLMLPWKCVLPVWYALMFYPLATGGNPRFGGLDEARQASFEKSQPWFPADYPGTKAGWQWELSERKKRKAEWDRRPKGRRIEWSSLDLGRGRKGELGTGWACDWDYLFTLTNATVTNKRGAQHSVQPSAETTSLRSALCLPGHLVSNSPRVWALTPVSITFVGRGLPMTCARIYRLPTTDQALRDSWLTLADDLTLDPIKLMHTRQALGTGREGTSPGGRPAERKAETRAALASSLLEGPQRSHLAAVEADDSKNPIVPDAVDLIGFVTTGNYNLGAGRGTAIGNIVLMLAAASSDDRVASRDTRLPLEGLCIVRETGNALGRLAQWEVAQD